ncbi:MAG: endonuclease/exonuclease/phosphatase family protein, partial [Planctomycetes bacterium]|nr:endonuclease/exonuclease/phosphatase family protein [Planctomycetota bacterium]
MNRLTTFLLGVIAAAIGWFVLENGGLQAWKDFRLTPRDGALTQTRAEGSSNASSSPPIRTDGTIRVASFNIQVLGSSKANKAHVMDILARIVREFDIVAIQEIRASDQDVIPSFVDSINTTGRYYDYVIGPRLGRTSSKEQYAFVFDSATVEVDRSQLYTIADPDDLLHREPLVAWFRVRGPPPDQAFTFTLVNIHTDPDETARELDVLGDVFRVVRDDGRNEDDVIILGDLNVDDRHLGRLGQISGITWVVTGTPTNTRGTAQYDNIVF